MYRLIWAEFGCQTWNSSESSPVVIVTGVRGWEISINVYFNDDSLFPIWVGLKQNAKTSYQETSLISIVSDGNAR